MSYNIQVAKEWTRLGPNITLDPRVKQIDHKQLSTQSNSIMIKQCDFALVIFSKIER